MSTVCMQVTIWGSESMSTNVKDMPKKVKSHPVFTLTPVEVGHQYFHLQAAKVFSQEGKGCLLKSLQQVQESIHGVELNEHTYVKQYAFALMRHLHNTCVKPKLRDLLESNDDTKSSPSNMDVPKWHRRFLACHGASVCVPVHAPGKSIASFCKKGGHKGYLYVHVGMDSNKKVVLESAHRLSLWVAKGLPRDNGSKQYECIHMCHNKKCINPFHLQWGTKSQNMRHHHARFKHVTKGKAFMPDFEEGAFPYRSDWYTRKAKQPPEAQVEAPHEAQPEAPPEGLPPSGSLEAQPPST